MCEFGNIASLFHLVFSDDEEPMNAGLDSTDARVGRRDSGRVF
jgi:hypothetical protein